MVKRHKKSLTLAALFLLLAQVFMMTFCNVTAIAETINEEESSKPQELFNNEYGKASIEYEKSGENQLNWTVELQKANYKEATRFMVDLKSGDQIITPENIQISNQKDSKLVLEDTTTDGVSPKSVAESVEGSLAGTAKITFSTTGNFASLTIKPKLIVVSTEADQKDLLADNSGVTYDFSASETQETTESSSSSISESEKDTASSSETVESTTSSQVESSSTVKDSTETSSTVEESSETTNDSSTTESSNTTNSTVKAISPLADPIDGGGLIISENSFSNDDNMKVITNTKGSEILTVESGSPTEYLNRIDYFRTHVRDVFLKGSSGHSIILPAANVDGTTKIKVFYNNVGYYNTGDGQSHQVAAMIELSNIEKRGYGSGNFNKVAIQFSNNMYSGVSYLNIGSFNMKVSFYDASAYSADTALSNFNNSNYDQSTVNLPVISFSQDGNSVMSFASLNPNTGGTNTRLTSYEFAGARDANGKTIKASSHGDLVALNGGGTGITDFLSAASKDTYFGNVMEKGDELDSWNGTKAPNGGDRLGLEKFWRTKVAFPLTGTENYFVVGSTGGEAWNTFSSSAVLPVEQSAPVKTVQPLQGLNEQADGTYQWSGDSDFSHRFDNDLDRAWEMPADERIAEHDPDSKSFLQDYLAQPEDRYLEKGDEFYYFINQRMINLYTQSVILPNTISISDTIPASISFDESQIVVYDLHGKVLANSNYSIQRNGQQITVSFNEAGTKLLNKQSGAIYGNDQDEHPEYGGTVSIRIRSKVTDSAPVLTDIDNSATSTFHYTQTGEAEKTQESNKVTIQVKDKVEVAAEKIWDDAENAAGIRPEITLQLQRKLITESDDQFKDVTDQQYIVKPDYAGEQLKHTFSDLDVANENGISYVYRVVETSEDSAFDLYTQSGGYDKESNTWKFTNSLNVTNLDLLKTDNSEAKKPLQEAEFSLVRNEDKYLSEKDYGTVHTDEDGKLNFNNLIEGSYTLSEITPPSGYSKLEEPITFDVVKNESGGLIITNLSDNSLVSLSGNQITVMNRLQTIKIKKIDSDTDKVLDGAVFELKRGEDVFEAKMEDGYFVFENLPQGDYSLTEVTAPDGYHKLPGAITFTIGENGEVTFTNNKDYITEYGIDKSDNGENNVITFNVINKPKAPLPSTGGPGTLLFSLIGMLALGATGLYFYFRKDQEVA